MTSQPNGVDPGLERVAEWFRSFDDVAERFGTAIRQGFDEVFDGQRTGRYRIDQLSKVEKSYIGTKVEIIVQNGFGLERGRKMDYLIVGEEVDAKWSMRSGGWMIPTEAIGEICLCITGDDDRGRFSVGLIRTSADRLTVGRNKDSKAHISRDAMASIIWIAKDEELPENLLLRIDDATRDAVLDPSLSGQGRINQLFHRVQERIVRREVVLTVAQQDDGPKRVRDARKYLAQYNIIILGHQNDHPEAARVFGLPVPRKGEWLSVSVVEATAAAPGAAQVDGRWLRPLFPSVNEA